MQAYIQFGHLTSGPFLPEEVEVHEKPNSFGWNARGANVMGYGQKITTRWMIRRYDEKRLRRVYATQWGNAGVFWFILNGKKEYLSFHY